MHHNTHTTKQEALIKSFSKLQLIHRNEYPHGNVGDSDVKLIHTPTHVAQSLTRTTIQYNSTHTNTIPELIIDALNFPRLGIKLGPLSNPFYPGPLLVAAPSPEHVPKLYARPQQASQKTESASNTSTHLSLEIRVSGLDSNATFSFRTNAFTTESHTMPDAHISYPRVTSPEIRSTCTTNHLQHLYGEHDITRVRAACYHTKHTQHTLHIPAHRA